MRKIIVLGLSLATMLAIGPADAAWAGPGDSDGDRMPDAWERSVGLNVGVKDGRRDPDLDGLLNSEEYKVDKRLLKTGAGADSHPFDADTDDDGTEDGGEDSDRDGLAAEDEFGEGTSWFKADSDRDGTDDGDEDADGDGLEDEFELGSVDEDDDADDDGESDETDDDDGDGTDNDDELDPDEADSDGDGTEDGAEDEDEDGLDNESEDEFDTDPCDEDSDDDGIDDDADDADGDDVDDGDDIDGDDEEDTDPTDDDADDDGDVFGTIVSYSSATGQLRVVTTSGYELSGVVTAGTEIEWEEPDTEADVECSDEDGSTADLQAGTEVVELGFDDDTGAIEEIALVCAGVAEDDEA